jgi:hypothetical protein
VDATWCVKSGTQNNPLPHGRGHRGGHPRDQKGKGASQNIGYVVVYDITVNRCFQAANWRDFTLTGALNTWKNTMFWATTDGSCGGEPASTWTLVDAADEAQASALCLQLTGRGNLYTRLADAGFPVPNTWWLCTW